MSETLSRRDVVMRTVPALAMAGALSIAGPLMAAENTDRHFEPGGEEAFRGGQYILPPLPYAYDALEPHIDAETMHLHHDKHHLAYVNGLNKTLKELAEIDAANAPPATPLLTGLQEDLSFNAAGHLLHTLFWKCMGPNAGGEPQGELADAIAGSFGSVAAFRTRFAAVALGVKGSGWAVLAYEPASQNLLILQVKQHDLQLAPWMEPILALDVWEHAYYLKYKNTRGEYIKAWWNVVNWPLVSHAFTDARIRYGGRG
jgi:Fe-Mn family superoxide dismutase